MFSFRTILSKDIGACQRRTTEARGYTLAAKIIFCTIRYHNLRGENEIDEIKTVARLGCDTDFEGR